MDSAESPDTQAAPDQSEMRRMPLDPAAFFGEVPNPEPFTHEEQRRHLLRRGIAATAIFAAVAGGSAIWYTEQGNNRHGAVAAYQHEQNPHPLLLYPSPSSLPKSETSITIPAPEQNIIAGKELTDIIEATRFKGLGGHSLDVIDRYHSADANIVLASIDHAPLPAPLTQIKADIAKAEAQAHSFGHFTAAVQLGPNTHRNITFDVSPAAQTAGAKRTIYSLPIPGSRWRGSPHQRVLSPIPLRTVHLTTILMSASFVTSPTPHWQTGLMPTTSLQPWKHFRPVLL